MIKAKCISHITHHYIDLPDSYLQVSKACKYQFTVNLPSQHKIKPILT